MKFITAKSRARVLYLDELNVQEILSKPSFYRVPASPIKVAGLIYYNQKLIPCYWMAKGINPNCAILLKAQSGYVFGLLAEAVGEEETKADILSALTEGIWEKKSD